MSIRVVIADDQAVIRSGLTQLLAPHPDIEVVATAATGREAVRTAQDQPVDLILMDIRMPDLDGVEATRAIRADPALSEVKVLVLTTFEVEQYVLDALRAGASGFLGKGVEAEDLVHAIRVVHAGEELLSPAATQALFAHLRRGEQPAEPDPRLAALTRREQEVLTLVGRGRSNDEIAEELVISPLTVKTHVARIMTKVDAHDRAALVVFAYDSGLIR